MSDPNAWQSFRTRPGAEMLTDDSIGETFLDAGKLEEFWQRWYLSDFISQGYGKVKFLFGGPGSGKTHGIRHLAMTAASLGYRVAQIDARSVRLADIEEFYRAVASALPIAEMIDQSCRRVIADGLGYREFDGEISQFAGWAEQEHGADLALFRRDVREAVDRWLHPQDLANDYLLAIRFWVNQRLVNEGDSEVAQRWLLGQRLTVAERKSLGVASTINRRNARAALSSLAALSHASGAAGMMVAIDNFDTVAKTARVEGQLYYTRGKRDQSYEMLRQIIDESVHTPYAMVVLAGDWQALRDTRSGFPSYPALWARIENEISTDKVNRFSDGIVLDRLWDDDVDNVKRLASVWSSHQPQIVAPALPNEPSSAVGLEWSIARRVVVAVMDGRDQNPLEDHANA